MNTIGSNLNNFLTEYDASAKIYLPLAKFFKWRTDNRFCADYAVSTDSYIG